MVPGTKYSEMKAMPMAWTALNLTLSCLDIIKKNKFMILISLFIIKNQEIYKEKQELYLYN